MQKTGVLVCLTYILLAAGSAMASDAARPKVGLVLSGGGAKGFAHIGTLKMIDSLQIPIDYIAGTSMGAIIGGLYAIGYSGKDLEELARREDWGEIFTDQVPRPDLPFFEKEQTGRYQLEFGMRGFKPVAPSGVIFGQKATLLLTSYTHPFERAADFDHLPIPFRCVAVDLVTGNEVVLGSGSLAIAMRASMSIPSVFSPVPWGDSLLVDGGVINNLPVDVVRKMGAEVVIAVDVQSPLRTRERLNDALAVLDQTVLLVGMDRVVANISQTDLHIQPDIHDYNASDFNTEKIAGILAQGETAARKALAPLTALRQKYNLPSSRNRQAELSHDPQETRINAIYIDGNKKLPFLFIYRLLGIKPGDFLNIELLNRRIMALYGMGYFETIHYEMMPAKMQMTNLIFHVKELPMRKLRVGLRYDDYHKLVAAVSLQATNYFIPGLRLENELQFAGLTRVQLRALYPSRTLNLPVYPLAQLVYNDIPIRQYDASGGTAAEYNDRCLTFGFGVGFLIANDMNATVEYRQENVNFKPGIALDDPELFPAWEEKLREINAAVDVDLIDDALVPCSGGRSHFEYEGSLKRFGSERPFQRISGQVERYLTFGRNHTMRCLGYHGQSSSNTPIYKYFNLGHPQTFIGLDYDQLSASRLTIGRLEYRYRHRKDIFFKLIGNYAFGIKYMRLGVPCGRNHIAGFGVGAMLLSPVGPIEIVAGWGEREGRAQSSFQKLVYFTMGYKF